MSRELDAEVARMVFGIDVLSEWLPAQWWADDDEMYVTPDRPENQRHPVFIDACMHEGWREQEAVRRDYLQEQHGWTPEERAELDAKSEAEWACGHYWQCFDVVPQYSESIKKAWLVVEKMRERGWDVHLDSLGFDGEEWRCFFECHDDERGTRAHGDAATAPLAICTAALNALSPHDGAVKSMSVNSE